MTPDVVAAVFLTLKILVLIGIGLYTIFAAIMVRQEQLMSSVLEESFEPILKLLTIIHLASAICLFLLALILL